MKYLIAGLGNIGSEYVETRHNIGFKILDALAEKADASFVTDRHADVCSTKWKGRQLILIKPNTYMNLSGKAIRYWMQEEKIPIERLLVVVDDIALPFGKIRLRKKGSDAGHNGLKNIQELLGTNQYPRLRFGIGDEFGRGQQINYVLGEWSEKENEELPSYIEPAVNAILSFTTIGLTQTMNQYN